MASDRNNDVIALLVIASTLWLGISLFMMPSPVSVSEHKRIENDERKNKQCKSPKGMMTASARD